jgi:hypothetical protein
MRTRKFKRAFDRFLEKNNVSESDKHRIFLMVDEKEDEAVFEVLNEEGIKYNKYPDAAVKKGDFKVLWMPEQEHKIGFLASTKNT